MEHCNAASDKDLSVTEEDLAAVRKVIEETFAKVVKICDGDDAQAADSALVAEDTTSPAVEVAAETVVAGEGEAAAAGVGQEGVAVANEIAANGICAADAVLATEVDVVVPEDDGLAATVEEKIAVIEDACPSAEEAVAVAAAKFAAEVEDVVALAKGAIADLELSNPLAKGVSGPVKQTAAAPEEIAAPAAEVAPAAKLVEACAEEKAKVDEPVAPPLGNAAVTVEADKKFEVLGEEQAAQIGNPSEQAPTAVEEAKVDDVIGGKDAAPEEPVPPAEKAITEEFDAGKALAEVYEKVTKLCDEVDNTDDYKGSQSMTSSKENVSPAEEEDYEGHDEHEHEHEHEHEQPHPNPPSLPPRHDRSVSGGSNHAPRFMQATTAWKGKGDGVHARRSHNSRPAWVSASVSKRDSTFEPTMRLKVSQINTGDHLHRSRSTTPPQDPSLPRYMQATAAVVGKYSSDSDAGSSGRRTPVSGRSHKVHHKDPRRATPVPFY